MISIYLLQNCKYCDKILNFVKKNKHLNICIVLISRDQLDYYKKNDSRFTQFPVAFDGSMKQNGLPYKNAKMLTGSDQIIQSMRFGKLYGNPISIKYDKERSTGNITNIRQYRKNCFGKACNVMDRPYGPQDNMYILQGYQPSCATPVRSDLPIKSKTKFGTTPGTKQWQAERTDMQKTSSAPQKIINASNCRQMQTVNTDAKLNIPMTAPNDKLNQKCKFGKINSPINSNAPFLTWAAGGTTYSRTNGKQYLPQQVPIKNSMSKSMISRDIKQYVKNKPDMKMLQDGLNSPWSINAQGINSFGGDEYSLLTTATNSGQGAGGIAQYWKPRMHAMNGNLFDFGSKTKPIKSIKPPKPPKKAKEPKKKPTKAMKFTTPLGVEFTIH